MYVELTISPVLYAVVWSRYPSPTTRDRHPTCCTVARTILSSPDCIPLPGSSSLTFTTQSLPVAPEHYLGSSLLH